MGRVDAKRASSVSVESALLISFSFSFSSSFSFFKRSPALFPSYCCLVPFPSSPPLSDTRHVPTTNSTLLSQLYGSITDIATYPPEDPIRLGAIAAYQAVMYKLVLGAVAVAIIPPVVCLVWTKDVKLGSAGSGSPTVGGGAGRRMGDQRSEEDH